jgi:ligand-binding SRPBCC domain-containing protein
VPVIDITTQVQAPIQRVFDLSRSVDLHTASTAHTGERAVAGVTSGLMVLGHEVTWRARHLGFWQNLTSRITAFEPPTHFRDSLVRGAFRRFDHDHFFSQQGDITLMRDVFDYRVAIRFYRANR